MDSRLLLITGCAAALIVGFGMTGPTTKADVYGGQIPSPAGIKTMTVQANLGSCRVPRPPRELHRKAYIRNSYAAVLEIIAGQHWQETGSCDCFFEEVDWSQVVGTSMEFETEDTPIPPFNLNHLRAVADDLNSQKQAACE
ncbi:hypothetical protein PhaeoP23_03935 (plasmid) [Phaeobacter piscinae]|uniref:Beta/Gamma crystallin n=1 Tax=Phaeobacter piscinae TaxID=1580596 RepID=A0ABM6PL29_9RHOB|nr:MULTISPECIES: hypothetical protein [Phaeobacter]ATG38088.1 hypothetical protein PhaeoP36_04013 [Phaeobacter piscinae]AUQ88609.1 hypothetical protein PhaeoP42_04014 [Phaeobacter piscinae]AUQ92598.1 hypothetical protein PhaeoP24_04040 [Phaeobacter inhibens]AUR26414.1 hypothetical protein PhaeoP23_03935 [Phaeobacter piscinae]